MWTTFRVQQTILGGVTPYSSAVITVTTKTMRIPRSIARFQKVPACNNHDNRMIL